MPSFRFLSGVLLVVLALGAVYGAPAPSQTQTQSDLSEKIAALQQQLLEIQSALNNNPPPQVVSEVQPAPAAKRSAAWQPMKRMVAWQPMKRSDQLVSSELQRDQLIRAIEAQLSDVLHAGETLGVTAEEVLAHLRQRNDNNIVFQ